MTFGFASVWATGKHSACIQYSDPFISTRCDTDINVRISCAGFPLACCSGCALITRLIRLQLLFSGHYRGGGLFPWVNETRLICQRTLTEMTVVSTKIQILLVTVVTISQKYIFKINENDRKMSCLIKMRSPLNIKLIWSHTSWGNMSSSVRCVLSCRDYIEYYGILGETVYTVVNVWDGSMSCFSGCGLTAEVTSCVC